MVELEKIVRTNIAKLKPYSSAREEYEGTCGVFLDANENPYGTLNRYPDPFQSDLKNKLADLKKVNPDQIFIGNGSDEIIDLAFRIFCEPGKDKALIFPPTYGMYEVLAGLNDVELIKCPLSNSCQIDTQKCDKCLIIKDLKLIFICSPNNPTGNLIDKKAIDCILRHFRGIVIIDEAYIDFSDSESWLEVLSNHPNLIICQTLSKAWGLASVRIGIAYAAPAIIEIFNKVKAPYNVSEPNQNSALEVLSDTKTFDQNLVRVLREKEKLEESFSKLPFVKKIFPSSANFFMVEVTDANRIYQYLIDKQVVIRNRNRLVKNCIRITVGTLKENQKLLEALKNYQK